MVLRRKQDADPQSRENCTACGTGVALESHCRGLCALRLGAARCGRHLYVAACHSHASVGLSAGDVGAGLGGAITTGSVSVIAAFRYGDMRSNMQGSKFSKH